ncbi:MAG: TatD family hydrolase, partial [Treponema sp.]|nr:TatD family hydrolase [Treponema sp.]
ATEAAQDEFFARHLDAALQYRLPIVLHVRRALHKIFPYTRELKKLPAVVFHSWPGTAAEGEALVRRGINAFFSFGTTILNNHRAAMHCAARFPPDRILLETDAPYQPLRGTPFSSWRDLPQICAAIATLRTQAASPAATSEEVQSATTANFFRVFGE